MTNSFYDKYNEYSKQELFEILLKREEYEQEAVEAVAMIIKENDWIEEFKEEYEREEEEYQKEVAEKAEYYRKAVEFKNDQCYYDIRTNDAPLFEAKLVELGIDFFKEQKHIGFHRDSYPSETYYVKQENSEIVDKVCVEHQLLNQPNSNEKKYFGFVFKVFLIIILIIICAIIFLLSCSDNKEYKAKEIKTYTNSDILENPVPIDTISIDQYSNVLQTWLGYYKKYSIKLTGFKFIKEEILPDISAKVDSFDLENDIYRPFYKYSSDSSIILDVTSYNIILEKNDKNELVSYGADIDSEASIKDLNNNIWKRILFIGPCGMIEDGFWINNNQMLIVGQLKDISQNETKPMVWFVDLKSNNIQNFEYESNIDDMKCDYLENVKYKGIKEAK